MALVKCKECGKQVSTQAKACPSCGAKVPKPVGFLGWALSIAVAGFVFTCATETTKRLDTESQVAAQQTAPPATTAEPTKQTWDYITYDDNVSGKKGRMASLQSDNIVEFRFPYQGKQRASLDFDIHPRYGRRVILALNKAHFHCYAVSDDCYITVRFDGGGIERFAAAKPSDQSTTLLFVRDHNRFIELARKAKIAYIEAPFYQDGTRTFEFSVDGYQPEKLSPATSAKK